MKTIICQCMVMITMTFLLAGAAHATLINGDFSDLSGWESEAWVVVDPSDPSSIDVVQPSPLVTIRNANGEAELHTAGINSGIFLTSLFQSFAIPDLALSLSFDVKFDRSTSDDTVSGGNNTFPDFLEAYFVDDQDNYSKWLGIDFFTAYDPVSFDLISLMDLGGGWWRFTTGISALAGCAGTIYFDLWDGDDGWFSTAWVDNVTITEKNLSPVPEPATLLFLGLGLIVLGCMGRRRLKN